MQKIAVVVQGGIYLSPAHSFNSGKRRDVCRFLGHWGLEGPGSLVRFRSNQLQQIPQFLGRRLHAFDQPDHV